MADIIRPTFEQQQAEWYANHYRWCHFNRPGAGEARRQYLVQQEQARVANYRLAWSQDLGGYFAQWRDGEKWLTIAPVRTCTAEASLDAKLNAGQCGTECRLHPQIANLTEGRAEYGDVDLTKPYPGW